MAKKVKTVLLDSSVWIAYLYTEDSHHERAVAILERYKDCIFLVPEIVYFETLIAYYALHTSITSIAYFINYFETDNQVNFCKMTKKETEYLILKHLELIQLKSSDFQILMYVIDYNPDVFVSFDKRLKREYSKIVFNQDSL